MLQIKKTNIYIFFVRQYFLYISIVFKNWKKR